MITLIIIMVLAIVCMVAYVKYNPRIERLKSGTYLFYGEYKRYMIKLK